MVSAITLLLDDAWAKRRDPNAGSRVSVAQAAAQLGCSPTTVRRRAACGVLASSRDRRSLKIQQGAIDALLDARREPPSVAFRQRAERALRQCTPRGAKTAA
jgi:hypothetical protein